VGKYLEVVRACMPGNKVIAIIGNGCAAMECIKSLRENNDPGEIHLFSDNRWPSYNPMLTTYYAAGRIDFETFFPYGYNFDFYKDHGVHLHLDAPVVRVDAVEQTIENRSKFKITYDQCLVATGARPFLPSIEGITSRSIYVMRTIEDSIAVKKALQGCPRKALIIGASVTGVKIVEMFHGSGVSVCLADMAPHILPLAAHPDCAGIIEDRLVRRGIRLRLGTGIERIEETSAGLNAYFTGESKPEGTDLIVMCTGMESNIAFLDKKQVKMDRGILVDKRMQTNVSNLYAAGDVAQGLNLLTGENQIIGLWANARYQGRAAGKNMAGIEDEFIGNIPHNMTHFMDMVFVGIGDIRKGTREEKQYDGMTYRHFVWDRNRLVGINLLDDFTEAGIYEHALLRGLRHDQKTSDRDALSNLVDLIGEFKKN